MGGAFVLSRGAFDEYYGQALRVRRLICDELADALKDHRCLLAPTVASFDVPLAELKEQSAVDGYCHDVMTVAVSLAGLPALTLGNGTQLIGRHGDEVFLFQTARRLEAELEPQQQAN